MDLTNAKADVATKEAFLHGLEAARFVVDPDFAEIEAARPEVAPRDQCAEIIRSYLKDPTFLDLALLSLEAARRICGEQFNARSVKAALAILVEEKLLEPCIDQGVDTYARPEEKMPAFLQRAKGSETTSG